MSAVRECYEATRALWLQQEADDVAAVQVVLDQMADHGASWVPPYGLLYDASDRVRRAVVKLYEAHRVDHGLRPLPSYAPGTDKDRLWRYLLDDHFNEVVPAAELEDVLNEHVRGRYGRERAYPHLEGWTAERRRYHTRQLPYVIERVVVGGRVAYCASDPPEGPEQPAQTTPTAEA